MAGTLVDSNVWIDLSKKSILAAKFLSTARSRGPVAYSILSEMEVIQGARNRREREVLESIFKCYTVVPLDSADSWIARQILKSKGQKTGIGIIDAMIAASAIRMKMELATLNVKHFKGITGLKVVKPY